MAWVESTRIRGPGGGAGIRPCSRDHLPRTDDGHLLQEGKQGRRHGGYVGGPGVHSRVHLRLQGLDRKSTRLNSSHVKISYAVFCLKKKKNTTTYHPDVD